MKALTLHQPWASLIAVGAKRIETRSWPTSYRGPLAVHASTRVPASGLGYTPGRIDAVEVLRDAGVLPLNAKGGPICPGRARPASYTECLRYLPLGAVVATCELVDCHPIVGDGDLVDLSQPYVAWWSGAPPGSPDASLHIWEEDEAIETITAQAPFGNFTPGRFAWMLEDVRALEPPVPARGAQRLWNWTALDAGDDE